MYIYIIYLALSLLVYMLYCNAIFGLLYSATRLIQILFVAFNKYVFCCFCLFILILFLLNNTQPKC